MSRTQQRNNIKKRRAEMNLHHRLKRAEDAIDFLLAHLNTYEHLKPYINPHCSNREYHL